MMSEPTTRESLRGEQFKERRNITSPFDNNTDVLLLPSPIDTYLCEYLTDVTQMPSGCVLSCGAGGQHDGGDFNCHVHTRYVKEESEQADIVVNHFGSVPQRYSNGRPYLTLYYSGESNYSEIRRGRGDYPVLHDRVVSCHQHRQNYFTYTHHHKPYFMDILRSNNKDGGEAQSATWSAWKQRHSAVAVFLSTCLARRAEVIHRLSRYYPVHNYGWCVNTHRVPDDCAGIGGRYDEKMCVMRKYKYAMALENSREQDYVTEKVYHALVSGGIPLYWGAPNIDDFVPMGRRSIVDVEPFIPGQLGDSPLDNSTDGEGGFKRLGDYLRRLESEEVSVNRLLAWRRARRAEEWGERFVDNMNHLDPLCAVCAEAREKRRRNNTSR
ncbi:Alpha-(1,3)-fucosyltransferase, family GT10 [Trypanosoma grayi]|uniref:Alpha-(1,3)-fucosyltransferase, family GT10 n=1 Tax=Trypanosoma grayi TaxID=71804 RepID=UPI0004F42E4C|nr:Alpha-(1,3)-fucosyltransferase, family GT10 [Trypanosoma grayi]KEG05722.1 Alpha-(1,3)-fucosyltransferase, family GT10 [Trypanosoma grayi]